MTKPILFGKYLLLERINVGGMAEVFIAKTFGVQGFEKILAIKKILPTMAEDEEFITMFVDEARLSAQLNHANIAHIIDFGKHDENYFITMEYVEGKDLRSILERFRRRKEQMSTAQAVFIASKMCEGLDYAHRKRDARGNDLNIIHRDVSPQNVLVSYEGEVKLIDFGIAKAANRSQKTQAGILKGKFGYMSPEQVRGLELDRRSDIFAVGVILYEMLTGERLFVGDSDFSTLEKVRAAEVPLLRTFNPGIDPGLEQVVLKALAREPDERYQWASDLQEDLTRYQFTGNHVFTSKQLAAFMKSAFSEELRREGERMERYSAIERLEPDDPGMGAYAHRTPIPLHQTTATVGQTQILADAPAAEDEEPVASPAPRHKSVSKKVVVGDPGSGRRRAPEPDEGAHEEDVPAVEPKRARRPGSSSGPRPSPEPQDLAAPRGTNAKKWAILGGTAAAVVGAVIVAALSFSGSGSAPAAQASVVPPESPSANPVDPLKSSGPAKTAEPELVLEPEPPPPPKPLTFAARFDSRTPGVEIRLADRVVGRTPDARAEGLEVGKTYQFTAEKAGFLPYSGEFKGTATGELVVSVVLARKGGGTTVPTGAKKMGGLACSTRPAGAEIWVNNKPTGRVTPVALGNPVQLPAGSHLVQFRMNGKRSPPRMVEIKAGEVARLVNIPLE